MTQAVTTAGQDIAKSRTDEIANLYMAGNSTVVISEVTGISKSTVQSRLKGLGILRSRADAIRVAGEQGRLGGGMRGKNRQFSPAHCEAISQAKKRWGEANAKGYSKKQNGYFEYTRGPDKGRLVHVVVMEQRLGRRLKDDEAVHHIDGDKTNNEEHNLALVTAAGHIRLHRFENSIRRGNQ